jgi:hypothetical protein
MATVAGGLFHPAPTAAHVAASPRPDAGPLSLASITNVHTTIAGGAATISGGAGGGSDTVGSGFDTVSGPQGEGKFAGSLPASTEQVVATQTQEAGNLVLHLADGSTITLVGVTHVDSSFIH